MKFNPDFINKIEQALRSKLTDDRFEIRLDYNDHKSSYSTLEYELGRWSINEAEWHDQEDREQAIATNTLWKFCASGDEKTPAIRYKASTLYKLLTFFGEFDATEVLRLEEYLLSCLYGTYANFGFSFNPHKGKAKTRINGQWQEYRPSLNEWLGFTDDEYRDAETVEEKAELADYPDTETYQKSIADDTMWVFSVLSTYPGWFLRVSRYHAGESH